MKLPGTTLRSETPRLLALRGNNAFTLIELLTVIVILGVLASLLFPALSGMTKRGQAAEALNNLRQSYMSIRLFAAENDGEILPADIQLPYSFDRFGIPWKMLWVELLDSSGVLGGTPNKGSEIGRKKKIFQNPAMISYYKSKGTYKPSPNPNDWSGCTWSRNGWIGVGVTGESENRVTRFHGLAAPSKTLLLTEGSKQNNDNWFWIDRKFFYPPSGTADSAPPEDFQGGKSHVLYCDGHIDLIPHSDIPPSAWATAATSDIDPWLFWKGSLR